MKENYLVDVIIPLPLNRHYTYSSKSRVEIGTHLKVPFGNNNEIAEKFKDLLLATNIFGWGTLVNQALEAKEFGSSPLVNLAGPAASSIDELVNAISNLNAFDALFKEEDIRPRALATWIAKNFTPFLGNIPEFRERVRDIIKPD